MLIPLPVIFRITREGITKQVFTRSVDNIQTKGAQGGVGGVDSSTKGALKKAPVGCGQTGFIGAAVSVEAGTTANSFEGGERVVAGRPEKKTS